MHIFNSSYCAVEVDYVMKNRKVQLIPGRDGGSGQVQVMIPNDYLLEDDEEFVIYLELQSGSSAFLDISSTIIVIIGDQGIHQYTVCFFAICHSCSNGRTLRRAKYN